MGDCSCLDWRLIQVRKKSNNDWACVRQMDINEGKVPWKDAIPGRARDSADYNQSPVSALLQLKRWVLSLLAKRESSLNWVGEELVQAGFSENAAGSEETRTGLHLNWVILKACAGSLYPYWLVALTVPCCSFGNPVCGPKIHVHLIHQWVKHV